MTAPGVEGVLAEVLADQRCANVHGDHWRAIGERGRANHWACESCKSWGAHVAAEQAKALLRWSQQDETIERVAYDISGCTSWANWHAVDEDAQDEERSWSRAVLTAIFGSPDGV